MFLLNPKQRHYLKTYIENVFPQTKNKNPKDNYMTLSVQTNAHSEDVLHFLIRGDDHYLENILFAEEEEMDMLIRRHESPMGLIQMEIEFVYNNHRFFTLLDENEVGLQEQVLDILDNSTEIHVLVTNQKEEIVKTFIIFWDHENVTGDDFGDEDGFYTPSILH